MKKITFWKSLLMVAFFLIGTLSASSQLLVENFDYPVGSLLTAYGWTAHSGAGTQAIDVTDGLIFTGYAGSGIGGAARLDNNGEDVYKTFTTQTSGVLYSSFLLNTTTPNSAGYFYMFAQGPATTNFIARVYINAAGDGIGISNSGTAPATFVSITPGTTVLVVVKYDFTTQLSQLYVLNSYSSNEPATPNQTSASTGTLTGGVGSIALRQYNASQRQIIDGIRVGTTWEQVVAPASATPTVATPTFSPVAGTYSSAQAVTISTTTEGASIYYTTNGDEPTELSDLFETPINIASTTTLKAKAFKAEMTASATASAEYVINTTPTIVVTETTLSGFTYLVGNGPSAAQQFTFSGTNLTAELSVNAPTDYQISLTGADDNYHNWIGFNPQSGSVANTNLFVRLVEGLQPGNKTGDITFTSEGAAPKTITLNGRVTEPVTKPAVIISEVYGGGGNSGATLKNDFIELYNTSAETAEIGGWSIQYFSTSGTGTPVEANVYVIPEGKYIPSGAHFLIKAAAGTGGTEDLFQPDAASTLTLGGSGGKIILYSTSVAQPISDLESILSNVNFVDYVPYGASTPIWGSAMASTTNTTSATRNTVPMPEIPAQRVISAVNYMYTGNIGNDFSVLAPSPTSTGLNTGFNATNLSFDVYVANGNVQFNSTSNLTYEVYNTVGQLVANGVTIDGLNSVAVSSKGVMLVKVGDKVAKVIM